ncbi:MAG: D-sedoheptulose 7-phosphate isomerase [Candidatus Wallbacteria bacterium]|nr:D-sedoheptulose 7-phosphate isomerase [Candidatus Wallbacteria bacterium]
MDKITQSLQNTCSLLQKIIADAGFISSISKAADEIVKVYRSGRRVYFCGNGGSAADAQHLAAELTGRFYYDREPLDAEALHTNTSHLTAVANDYSFDEVFARLLHAKGKKGDLLVGISTSGNSKNILRAFEEARKSGLFIIGLTGEGGGKMKDLCDLLLAVPSRDTPRIQEAHITIGHIICELVESTLFPK